MSLRSVPQGQPENNTRTVTEGAHRRKARRDPRGFSIHDLHSKLKLKGDEVCSVYEADLPETTEAPDEAIPQN